MNNATAHLIARTNPNQAPWSDLCSATFEAFGSASREAEDLARMLRGAAEQTEGEACWGDANAAAAAAARALSAISEARALMAAVQASMR